ncbi:MAG TPA: AarF/ABC1/UbiB kinase family protein [Burkholderiales bacterium]|nr:AarF/ABC1/UbiB kinase family protein [Burkholderiales bacterium]
MTSKRRASGTAVPQTRLGRLVRLGLAAGEIAVGGAVEGLKRLASAQPIGGGSVFLTAASAERLAARLARLRGAAMKLGQLLSLEGEDAMPPEFAGALATLRSGASPMPAAQLHRVLGREWGARWVGRFAAFDEEPVAAASIGQVHRARTADGRDVAIKVQYPGVARSIDSDVDNVAVLLRLLNLLPLEIEIGGLVAEAKRQLHEEADYLAEARHLARFRRLVADEPRLAVPRVHTDLTTQRVLAMDYVHGEPLETLIDAGVPQSARNEIGALLQRLVFRELFEFRAMQTDPNFANYLWDRDAARVVLLDFGATREFPRAFVEHFRAISRAVVAGNRARIRALAIEIGYLGPEDSRERAEAVVEVIQLVCEPLRHSGPYDFAGSDLPSRVRSLGFDLAFRKGLLRAPPPETLFLHRKLVGSFLLLARIGARVNAHALVLPFLRRG